MKGQEVRLRCGAAAQNVTHISHADELSVIAVPEGHTKSRDEIPESVLVECDCGFLLCGPRM